MPKKGGQRSRGSAASKMEAFFAAVRAAKLPTVRWSLSNVGSLEASSRDPEGKTSFMVAAACGKEKSLSMLVDFYARSRVLREKGWVELKDEEGRTALHFACASGHVKCVDVLLEVEPKHHRGGGEALLAITDNAGLTPRDLAVRKQKRAVVELIDYFLAPEEEMTAAEAEAKVGADGLTSAQRKELKRKNFKLSDREQAAERRKATEAEAAEKRQQEAAAKPAARWEEVRAVEESVAMLKPVHELHVLREDAEEFEGQIMGSSPVDPALWYLHTLNRLEMRLPAGVLTSLPGAGLARLEDLQVLILSGNSLGELPDELGGLASLRVLEVAGNELVSLPATIGQLQKLETVDMARNRLESLAPLSGLPNIVSLVVDSNQLQSIDLDFACLKRLQRLQASHNPVARVPSAISEASALQTLDVSNTSVSDLPASLSTLKKLKHLGMDGCTIANPKIRKKVAAGLEGKGLKELLKVVAKVGSTGDDGDDAAGGERKSGAGKKKKKKKKRR